MNRISTARWEEVKHLQNKCLCYSKEKGLYVSDIISAVKENVLFLPHGYKGFWNQEKTIQEENLKIKLETNFGYGIRTYMRAIVEKDGQRFLDFDLSKMNVLNNCSITTLNVEPYDWEKLFNKIVFISKGFDPQNCFSSAINYIEKIDSVLDEQEIFVKSTFFSEETFKWEGEYLVALFVAGIIKDVIKGCQLANITDEYFIGKCSQLFRKFLCKIQEIDIDLHDRRTAQLADTLFLIHEFMVQNKTGLDFLEFFISRTKE